MIELAVVSLAGYVHAFSVLDFAVVVVVAAAAVISRIVVVVVIVVVADCVVLVRCAMNKACC